VVATRRASALTVSLVMVDVLSGLQAQEGARLSGWTLSEDGSPLARGSRIGLSAEPRPAHDVRRSRPF
jgi:hypothetical protein